ncbi:MAG: T9SS type A sorting domain-containing protein [Bacteroidales bacterium]|nr:T9SS type A sorting domain-containing protein [Bacteroidales bacterium]
MLKKSICLFISVIAGVVFLQAQSSFSEENLISDPELRDPRDVMSSDLNGDGDPDIVIAAAESDKIAWYENDGNGGFGSQQVITTNADYARSVYVADLNGNSKMDVLSASENDNKIAWYENMGNGNFGPQHIISLPDGARSVYAADLNGNGNTDVIFSANNNLAGNKIAWCENNGNGNFGSMQVIGNSTGDIRSVFAVDIDNDNNIDVLAGSDKIAWYKNDGNGNFSSGKIIANNASGASVYAFDLDNDGNKDILSALYGDDKITWYKNQGNGSFGSEQTIDSLAFKATSVYVSDFNNDGKPDILSTCKNNEVAWYNNQGNGNFGPRQIINDSMSNVRTGYASDIDGDGQQDVLVASFGKNLIHWYKNKGAGNFEIQNNIVNTISSLVSIDVVDLNNDGYNDVFSASKADNKLAWYENDGNGNFGPQQIITTNANNVKDACAANLNRDNYPDILSASIGDNTIAWYPNDGNGNFPSRKIISDSLSGGGFPYHDPYLVCAADMNNNGHQDVIAASNKIVWFPNDGSGNFGPQKLVADSVGIVGNLTTADLNGDGDKDILIRIDDYGDKIVWFQNDGNGNFDNQQVMVGVVSQRFFTNLTAVDLNGNNDKDVLTGVYSNGVIPQDIIWYENQGLGTFNNNHNTVDSLTGIAGINAFDFDNDGDKDVISGTVISGFSVIIPPYNLSWYKNDGNGSFSTYEVIEDSIIGHVGEIHGKDIDGDNYKDVIVTYHRYDHGRISWYKNKHPVGISDQTSLDYSLYPNPTTGLVKISAESQIKSLFITDITGKTVRRYDNLNTRGKTIDLSGLKTGIYLARIQTEKGVFSAKVIKE